MPAQVMAQQQHLLGLLKEAYEVQAAFMGRVVHLGDDDAHSARPPAAGLLCGWRSPAAEVGLCKFNIEADLCKFM